MAWIWMLFAALTTAAGVRQWRRVRAVRRRSRTPQVDDAALRRILETGTLATDDDEDEVLDMDAAARAEEEFWNESWDEPEEFRRG